MNDRYTARLDQTAAQTIDDEAVVINFETYHYYGLNRTGTAVWRLLQEGGRTCGDIATLVAQAFAAPREVVTADVSRLIAQLVAEGLAEPTTTSAGPAAPLPHSPGYVTPTIEKHDKLDQLVLSGE
jgi:hypothetical protein